MTWHSTWHWLMIDGSHGCHAWQSSQTPSAEWLTNEIKLFIKIWFKLKYNCEMSKQYKEKLQRSRVLLLYFSFYLFFIKLPPFPLFRYFYNFMLVTWCECLWTNVSRFHTQSVVLRCENWDFKLNAIILLPSKGKCLSCCVCALGRTFCIVMRMNKYLFSVVGGCRSARPLDGGYTQQYVTYHGGPWWGRVLNVFPSVTQEQLQQ